MDRTIDAPSAAIVKQILATEGAVVAAGSPAIVLSIMKMDVTVTTPWAGRVHRVLVQPGAAVRRGERLLEIDLGAATAQAKTSSSPSAEAAAASSPGTSEWQARAPLG